MFSHGTNFYSINLNMKNRTSTCSRKIVNPIVYKPYTQSRLANSLTFLKLSFFSILYSGVLKS